MIEWVVEGRLARSARPGAGDLSPDSEAVDAWLTRARGIGVRSILCLLDTDQLARYTHLSGGLLATYRRAGFAVGHLPIPDMLTPPIPPATLPQVWDFFRSLPGPVLIHCWAGIDRTGAAVAYVLRRLDEEAGR